MYRDATPTEIREAATRAAATLTEHPRDGWMCAFASRHLDGPCRSCRRLGLHGTAGEAVPA